MLNKCAFIGNLGRDPEIRTISDGKEVANLSLGVSEKWVDKASGERKTKTEWVRITIWNPNLVTVAKSYLKKGSKVYIEGQMQTRKYTDKDGVEKYTTEIVLQNFGGTLLMLDGKKSDTTQQTSVPSAAADLDDEIPFAWIGLIPLITMAMGIS